MDLDLTATVEKLKIMELNVGDQICVGGLTRAKLMEMKRKKMERQWQGVRDLASIVSVAMSGDKIRSGEDIDYIWR